MEEEYGILMISNYNIDDNGMCNIVDVTSTYGVSESEMINIYYNNIHHTVFSGSPIEPNSYEKRLTLTAPDSVNIVNNYIKELFHSSECEDVKSDADIMIVSYENFDTLYLSRSPYSCIMHTSPFVNDHYNCIEVDTVFYKLIYDVIRSKDTYFVQDTIRH
ncbi:MAG: hypothetical protein J6K28_05500 [Alistipes sp.]|nr:hypothetical protein [Alistipes sp.]